MYYGLFVLLYLDNDDDSRLLLRGRVRRQQCVVWGDLMIDLLVCILNSTPFPLPPKYITILLPPRSC